MTPQRARYLPWRPEAQRLVARGRLVVRLRETGFDQIPNHVDVTRGLAMPMSRLDGGRVDQRIRAFSPGMRVSRLYPAARNLSVPGKRHLGYEEDEHRLGMSRTYRVELDPDASLVNLSAALSALDAVESVSPHYLCEAPFAATGPHDNRTRQGDNDRKSGVQSGDYAHERIGAAAALAMEPGDSAVIVAIVDSGVASAHPEFSRGLRRGLDLVDLAQPDISRGVKLFGDYSGRDRDPEDEIGHGTACAGIIGASGLRVAPGIAGAAQILPMRALAGARMSERRTPTAIGGIPDIDAAVKCAVDLGARVLNLSFGTPASALRETDPVPHVDVVRYALARQCILIAASGNSGDDTAYFPACLPGVIAVGAVAANGRPASFSTRGAHVALCAPGQDIRTATVDGYGRQSGTSFAAPFVAGAAALIVSRGLRQGLALSPYTIRDLLMQSAAPHSAGVDVAEHGAGVLDIPAALALVDRMARSNMQDDDLAAGELSMAGARPAHSFEPMPRPAADPLFRHQSQPRR